MRNLLELVLDECDAEGRKGLAWVGEEAFPRQVLAEGEGNWLCPRPATHFDRDGRPPGTHDQLLPPPTLPLGYPLNLYGQVHEHISQANKRCLDQAGVGTSHDTLVDWAVAEILEEAM